MKIENLKALYRDQNYFGMWFILVIISLLTTLKMPYQGEEAVYTISTLEMAFNQEWLVPTQYGLNYARPPLLNWLMLPLAMILGWDQVLMASRLLTILITLSTVFLLIWFVKKLFKNRALAMFSALIYLSGDVLFRRGWLAYADPLFTLCVFGAIAGVWVALQEKRLIYIFLGLLGLIGSYLSKALTGYVFYGIALLVLFWKIDNRKFLLKPASVILHLLAFLFPVFWNLFLSQGSHGQSMLNDVLTKLHMINPIDYFFKVALFPLEVGLRWLPVSGILGYYGVKNFLQHYRQCKAKKAGESLKVWFGLLRCARNDEAASRNKEIDFLNIKIAAWILVLNLMPYWLSPVSHARYIMPVYPFIALLLAYSFWQMGKAKINVVVIWLLAGIVLRTVAGLLIFPYYEKHYRGNYQEVAKNILSITKDNPLYVLDVTATGLSVVANLDVLNWPKSIVTMPKPNWDKGFLLLDKPDYPNTTIRKVYYLGSHPLYLLCRGNDC